MANPPAPVPFEPTSSYDLRKVEDWPVYVNKRLVSSEQQLAADALRLLEFQLYDVSRRVPAAAVAKLRQIPIWLELDEPHHPCAVYHPDVNWLKDNGMNPDKARCVELSHARSFLTWTREQPMMMLHELAHGYQDRFLDGGNRNPRLAAAYERAVKSGTYADVLTKSFRRERAYGMTNPMEFFAEVTEAYFGTNDIYPFVAAELMEHDPETYALVGELWGTSTNASSKSTEKKPHLVIVAAEDEYRMHETLPTFANKHLASQFRISTVFGDPEDPNGFTNIEALKDPDVAIFSIRRRTPPAEQLQVIRQYLESGKPLVAIRTTSHAFAGRGETPVPDGHEAWPTFDREVLGCRYEGHYGNKDAGSPKTIVWVAEGTSPHAILSNVHRNEAIVPSWLYKNRDMGDKTNVLQWGRLDNSTEKEPVSWTNTTPWGGKVFYTMQGHPDDFASADFCALLKNATSWAIEGKQEPAN